MLAVNCGGIPVDDWKGESQEKPERTFAFNRPGPMAVDKRGDLWIVQLGNDFPVGQLQAAKYPAAVKCYTADGKFTGRQITDVVNPRAVAYDASRDEIIVGDNGPDLNVRIYSGLATKPMLARTFGAKGGIYAGKHPGKVIDETAGGAARFAGIAGVGVDRTGNLYVGGGFQGTDLRSFSPAGKLSWEVHSLMFCCTYDFDPASDGTEIYGTYNHLHLDLDQAAPGKEQRYAGYNWHWQRFGEPDRPSNSQAILRRLGKNKQLIMYTTSQGDVGEVKIYRYEGEMAIPAGGVVDNRTAFWCDLNGDGRVQSNEVIKMATGLYPTGVSVDSRGDMWVVCTATDGSFMRHFTCKGLTAAGVPIYSGTKGVGYEDVRLPEEGGKVNGWGMASRVDYNADEDRLIAYYPEVPRKGENDKAVPEYVMARYDNFRKSGGTRKWKVRGLRPESDPEYFMYEVNVFPYSGYMGLQACGNYVFFAYLFGEIHVFDINTGKLVEILSPGPEVNGQGAWEDASMGLRVTKTKSGEYLVFTENSGWGGKNHFYRWKP
jgi:sugar lactone lactonase YvrE